MQQRRQVTVASFLPRKVVNLLVLCNLQLLGALTTAHRNCKIVPAITYCTDCMYLNLAPIGGVLLHFN